VVDDPAERRRALDAFGLKYTGAIPAGYPDSVLASTVVVRLEPVAATGRHRG
jgi:hypothetical protein